MRAAPWPKPWKTRRRRQTENSRERCARKGGSLRKETCGFQTGCRTAPRDLGEQAIGAPTDSKAAHFLACLAYSLSEKNYMFLLLSRHAAHQIELGIGLHAGKAGHAVGQAEEGRDGGDVPGVLVAETMLGQRSEVGVTDLL